MPVVGSRGGGHAVLGTLIIPHGSLFRQNKILSPSHKQAFGILLIITLGIRARFCYERKNLFISDQNNHGEFSTTLNEALDSIPMT